MTSWLMGHANFREKVAYDFYVNQYNFWFWENTGSSFFDVNKFKSLDFLFRQYFPATVEGLHLIKNSTNGIKRKLRHKAGRNQ